MSNLESGKRTFEQMASENESPQVKLTENETKLFDHLLLVCKQQKLETIMRVAGGWVRDRVLGKESHDIDIALSDMTGKEFADHIEAFAKVEGHASAPTSVIQANPDQSKHLETTKVQLLGFEIDFVNLRTETYATDSRIPVMGNGTALEDALRRDLTINSLFYNINTKQVEDFTGRGLDDLKLGVIRTPLEPKKTLMDDPLRALRAVRFASRFGFKFSADLTAACGGEDVQAALRGKISRERVYQELDGMLSSRGSAVSALLLLASLGLFEVVFDAHPAAEDPKSVPESWSSVCVPMLTALQKHAALDDMPLRNRRVICLATCVAPLWKLKGTPTKVVRRSKQGESPSLAECTLRLRVKTGNEDGSTVMKVLNASNRIGELVGAGVGLCSRLDAGLMLRDVGADWELAVHIAMATAIAALPDGSDENAVSALYLQFSDRIVNDLKLDGIWNLKPLLDGREIVALLDVRGPQIGQATQLCIALMLENPTVDKARLSELLKEAHGKATAVDGAGAGAGAGGV